MSEEKVEKIMGSIMAIICITVFIAAIWLADIMITRRGESVK